MKRILLSATLAVSMLAAGAQDTKKVSTNYLLHKYVDAKTEVDKLVNDPKAQGKADVWFWAATVYGAIYDEEAMKPQYPGALEMAYTSFSKYVSLDPSLKIMNESSVPGKAVIDFLYRNNLKEGIATFDKKQWDSAYKYFGRAAEIGDLITKYDWRGNKQVIDTTTVLFTGYAAQNAKKSDLAAKYYTRLADHKITNATAAGDLKDIYEFLVYFYLQNKDEANFNKYLAIASELYPKNADNWADYQTEFIEKSMTLAQKLAMYDKLDAAGQLTSSQYLQFGNMFYNIKDEDRDKMDSATQAQFRAKAEDAFVKGYNKDKNNGLAAYNVGLLNYNDWVFLDDIWNENFRKIAEINRVKNAEKDPKKKAAAEAKAKKEIEPIKGVMAQIEKRQQAYADKAAQWMETTYTVLSTKEKRDHMESNVLGKTVDYLANIYGWKRDKAKGNNAEYDKYDALYKKYDVLHGKFN